MESQSYRSARLGDPLTADEYARIGNVAGDEIRHAFADFMADVTANRAARYKVAVLPTLEDKRLIRGGTYAGESRAIAGFGGNGAVSFEYVANGAMVFASASASRAEIVEAIGRGIGRVAIHEYLHQLLPHAPIDASTDVHSYEGNTAAMAEGYSGDLHWDLARPLLEGRLAPRVR